MKHIIILSALAALVSLQYVSAQTATSPRAANIVFEYKVYNYDTVERGADGNCLFRFTNTGNAPLLIADVNASCGCTKPHWNKKPVKPGESGVIRVTYNTNLTGRFRKTIVVKSNAANQPNVPLRITGFVKR